VLLLFFSFLMLLMLCCCSVSSCRSSYFGTYCGAVASDDIVAPSADVVAPIFTMLSFIMLMLVFLLPHAPAALLQTMLCCGLYCRAVAPPGVLSFQVL
jgi:hypothetical protein